MRCPKCHYLSFDPEPRCKNCGYGLSLEETDLFIRDDDDAQGSPFADLPIHADEDVRPISVPARPAAAAAARPAAGGSAVATATPTPPSPFAGLGGMRPAPDEPAAAATAAPSPVVTPPAARAVAPPPPVARSVDPLPEPQPVAASAARPVAPPTTELPLFVRGGTPVAEPSHVDEPLVRLPAESRPPLSVRRNVAETPQPKPRPTPTPPASNRSAGPLDRDLLADLPRPEASRRKTSTTPATRASVDPYGASAGQRLLAAAVDGVLLAVLSAAVMWITLRWCGLPLDRALMLSVLIPTSVFLSLVGIGYLVLFTAAGGQTLGKMAAGIRVIGDDDEGETADDGSLGLGQALLRAVLTLPSVLVAGVGFLPALVGDHRALHDRLAHTRVVRA